MVLAAAEGSLEKMIEGYVGHLSHLRLYYLKSLHSQMPMAGASDGHLSHILASNSSDSSDAPDVPDSSDTSDSQIYLYLHTIKNDTIAAPIGVRLIVDASGMLLICHTEGRSWLKIRRSSIGEQNSPGVKIARKTAGKWGFSGITKKSH
jgi:hypothetical protein